MFRYLINTQCHLPSDSKYCNVHVRLTFQKDKNDLVIDRQSNM